MESGHVELESIGFDLGAVLQKIVEMLMRVSWWSVAYITLETLPGRPGIVEDLNCLPADSLLNLVGNALKFTERGSVALRVELDPDLTGGGSIPGQDSARWLRFSVVDTGIGIAADKQVDFGLPTCRPSITRKYGGTGLGLAISKGLAQLMGGSIGCSSEEGRGSTFFLTAPFHIRKAPSLRHQAGQIITADGEPQPVFRILIVEDSADNRLVGHLQAGCFQPSRREWQDRREVIGGQRPPHLS